jgi:hypothetical protein
MLLALGHLPSGDMHCVLIIPAFRAIEATFPVLQKHPAEMAVPASRRLKLPLLCCLYQGRSYIVVASPSFTPA